MGAELFPGLRIVRSPIDAADWPGVIEQLAAGSLATSIGSLALEATSWSSTVLLGIDGATPAHEVVSAAMRPVTAVIATLPAIEIPPTSELWEWQCPPHLPRGPDLGSIAPHRRLLHWPDALLGIEWLGSADHAPPARLVVGRTQHEAWIARVKPNYEDEQLTIRLAWDAERIDPLSCSLVLRAENDDGIPMLVRHVRTSDLPSGEFGPEEARTAAWDRRRLDVTLPRGPRGATWGLSLLSADGRLLDERPAVPRIERIGFSLHVGGASAPSSTTIVGDRQPPPTAADHDAGVRAAVALERESREAAARRRISTFAGLEAYLRWRISGRQ